MSTVEWTENEPAGADFPGCGHGRLYLDARWSRRRRLTAGRRAVSYWLLASGLGGVAFLLQLTGNRKGALHSLLGEDQQQLEFLASFFEGSTFLVR